MAVYNAQKITLDLFPVKQAKILSPKGILLGNNVYKSVKLIFQDTQLFSLKYSIDGVWEDVSNIKIAIDSTWKDVKAVYVAQDGTWKQ